MTEILEELKMTEFIKEAEVEAPARFISKQEYITLKSVWSTELRRGYQPASWEFVVYNILRDKPADRGFKEKTKHIQGNTPWYALVRAINDALSQINPMRQRPITEFHGCPIPKKGLRGKLLDARIAKCPRGG